MIYASLNAKKGNYQYPAAINTALEFLAKPETAELPVGRYELEDRKSTRLNSSH